MNRVHFDYESFSEADIMKVGSYRYANDPSTEILMIGLALNDEEPVIWLPPSFVASTTWYSIEEHERAHEILKLACEDEDSVIYAHFAQFEIAMSDALLLKTTGIRPPKHSQWRCTAAMARRAALPDGLELCAKALRLKHQKDKAGDDLIKEFSCPQERDNKTRKSALALSMLKGKTLEKEMAKPIYKRRIRPQDRPEDFKRFTEYCKQDVRVETAIGNKLSFFELKGFALKTFQFDIEMNARGLPVNLKALANAQKIMDEEGPVVTKQFRDLTGLNPTQGEKFKAWAQERGYTGDNLQAATVEAFIESDDFDPESLLGQALLLRQKVSFAAIAKIPKMLMCAGPHDNIVRGTLLWHGAGPGRWSASLVQPHNMKRPSTSLIKNMPWKELGYKDTDDALDKFTQMAYKAICDGATAREMRLFFGDPLDVLASCIRHFIHDIHDCPICDGAGSKRYDEHRDVWIDRGCGCAGGRVERPMVSCDYSAIEAVLLAWLAGEEWRLKVFRTHGKIYEASASQMFGLTLEEITKPIRQKGKIAELALGYEGYVGALLSMGALKMGLKEEELPEIVDAWRKANKAIVAYWKLSVKSAVQATLNPGYIYECGKVEYFCKETAGMMYLFCRLPSRRLIAYPQPRVESQLRYVWLDPEKKRKVKVSVILPTNEDVELARERVGRNYYIKDSLTVYGEIKDNVLGRFALHGGVLVQNQCEGVGADIVSIGSMNLDAAGYKVISLIHDEALCLTHGGHETAEEMESLMLDLPPEYDGLPLKAKGEIVPFYKK